MEGLLFRWIRVALLGGEGKNFWTDKLLFPQTFNDHNFVRMTYWNWHFIAAKTGPGLKWKSICAIGFIFDLEGKVALAIV